MRYERRMRHRRKHESRAVKLRTDSVIHTACSQEVDIYKNIMLIALFASLRIVANIKQAQLQANTRSYEHNASRKKTCCQLHDSG